MCSEHDHIDEFESDSQATACHDNESHICNHCGKSHSQYFIKEHHCLMETLSQILIDLKEQCFKTNFQTRDPPLLDLFT